MNQPLPNREPGLTSEATNRLGGPIQLTTRQAIVWVLRHRRRLKMVEIARRMGISTQAVHKHCRAAETNIDRLKSLITFATGRPEMVDQYVERYCRKAIEKLMPDLANEPSPEEDLLAKIFADSRRPNPRKR